MKYIAVLYFLLSSFVLAQTISPEETKNEIYNYILNDIRKNNAAYPIKLIYLDNTVTKYNQVDLFSFDIELSEPEYKKDELICKLDLDITCVDKFEIDRFKLAKVFNTHNDFDYPDFYGIYAPLDHWYQFTYQVFSNTFAKNTKLQSEVIIPIKHTFFKNEVIINEIYFYKFEIDSTGKIIKSILIKY